MLAACVLIACCTMQLNFGEVHKIVGSHPALGSWDPNAAPEMHWNDGNVWTLDIDVQPNEGLDFKVCSGDAEQCARTVDGGGQQNMCAV